MFIDEQCIEALARFGIEFEPGLSVDEVKGMEKGFGLCFPPDYREFIMKGLPVGKSFINWRKFSKADLDEWHQWVFDGIRFDIENNVFWLPDWGAKPEKIDDAIAIARKHYDLAPRLIPVFGHRCMPTVPHEPGNPVFSVMQTDIIIYGANWLNYLENEFLGAFGKTFNDEARLIGNIRKIDFWTRIVDGFGEKVGGL